MLALVAVTLLCLVLAIGLFACDPKNSDNNKVVDPDEGSSESTETHEHTYSELLSDESKVVEFIDKVAQTTLSQEQNIVLKQYYVKGHDYVVTDVKLVYICDGKPEGTRSVKYFAHSFSNGIYVDDILAGQSSTLSSGTQTMTAFQYNVAENKSNQDVLTALYTAADIVDSKFKFFREETDEATTGTRQFAIFYQNATNGISKVTITVECGASKDELLSALADPTKVTVKKPTPTLIREGDTLVHTENSMD